LLGFESTPDGVNWEGHFCRVGTFPIGIDTDDVELKRTSPHVQPKIQAIAEMYTGKKILVGRDKLDLVKGVLQKLAAFEKFLTDYPEWRNKVVLIQVTDANNTGSQDKKKAAIEHKVSEMVARINGKFGSLEFTPVHHYHHHIQPDEYYALLSIADSALVTANRDGMSTVSLEYIMCQQENHGPLILSELTGTAGSMSSALMVNPWDYAGVAKAIHDALVMSADEKLSRHAVSQPPLKNDPYSPSLSYASISNYWIMSKSILLPSGPIPSSRHFSIPTHYPKRAATRLYYHWTTFSTATNHPRNDSCALIMM
jgi:trehalose 6-phosphate synthase/phosphatase